MHDKALTDKQDEVRDAFWVVNVFVDEKVAIRYVSHVVRLSLQCWSDISHGGRIDERLPRLGPDGHISSRWAKAYTAVCIIVNWNI